MGIYKEKNGFTVIETFIVIAIISLLLYMGGTISSKFALRRGIDDTANRITSELNLIKLQAARDGVQYRTTVTFTPGSSKNTLTIETKRGDSNRTSSFAALAPTSTEDYSFKNDYILDDTEYILDFNPNGTAVLPETIVLRPESEDTNINRCARVQISRFGTIRTIQGNWSFGASTCVPIADIQEDLGTS